MSELWVTRIDEVYSVTFDRHGTKTAVTLADGVSYFGDTEMGRANPGDYVLWMSDGTYRTTSRAEVHGLIGEQA